ncbi:MAG: lytic murein transglycosylase, partial [Solirubrobacterales bacterium]
GQQGVPAQPPTPEAPADAEVGGGTGNGGQGDAGGGGGGAAGANADSGDRTQVRDRDRDRDRSGGTKDRGRRDASFAGQRAFGFAAPVGSPIPSFLLPIFEDCGAQYGIPWHILAAINQVETAFGASVKTSSAGAIGWMQFLPSSWRQYGVDANGDGRRDPYDPEDAICAAASYLRAAGAATDMRGAIFAYNHAGWYVDMILSLARHYAGLDIGDPLPRATRLDREFAESLARIADDHDVDWAIMLAILRARGDRGHEPADADELRTLARRLAAQGSGRLRGPGGLAGSLFGNQPIFERRVEVLASYNHAVGLRGLVKGLYAVRDHLERRVLHSKKLDVYEGGRKDIRSGYIDVRLITLLLYLAERYDEITVTSLFTGHDYFASPGVPSAHAFGRAVDIAAVNGTPVIGNQQSGGVVERLVADLLILPGELQPAQVISLFELGGASFAAADHHDHVHVGF